MTLSDLKIALNKCTSIHEIISISRTWYWTSSKEVYNVGESLIISKANQLNKIYTDVTRVLVLR